MHTKKGLVSRSSVTVWGYDDVPAQASRSWGGGCDRAKGNHVIYQDGKKSNTDLVYFWMSPLADFSCAFGPASPSPRAFRSMA